MLAISVENLSKKFQLGTLNRAAFMEELRAKLARFAGRRGEAPPSHSPSPLSTSRDFWALRDINFEIKEGETVGIIGRNGAGKSTLLKILSRITAPTTGRARIKGRVGSLLEVGTGFHPELTGRENVYLYGSILGMKRNELDCKFDEIVSFAEVEKFVDTPVKHYSSGMMVRLAFSVAAFLEPEVLVVDEALSVGDAAFQEKCRQRMNALIRDGRTLLLVSHAGSLLSKICQRCIYLESGLLEFDGSTVEAIKRYNTASALQPVGDSIYSIEEPAISIQTSSTAVSVELKPRNDYRSSSGGDAVAALLEASLLNSLGEPADSLDFYSGGAVEFTYQIFRSGFLPLPNIHFFNQKGEYVMVVSEKEANLSSAPGIYRTKVKLPPHFLNAGRYTVGLCVATLHPEVIHHFDQEALVFEVFEDMEKRSTSYRLAIPGHVRPKLDWKTERIK